jgi:hypothetical protein
VTPVDMPKEFKFLLKQLGDSEASALNRLFAGSALKQGLDELLTELAQAAREEEGFSWADVGKVLDITKQAAQQRFGRRGVITVTARGDVKLTENRAEYEARLREALDELEARGLDVGDIEPTIVEVEVEMPVDVEAPATRKVVKRVVKKKVKTKDGKKR